MPVDVAPVVPEVVVVEGLVGVSPPQPNASAAAPAVPMTRMTSRRPIFLVFIRRSFPAIALLLMLADERGEPFGLASRTRRVRAAHVKTIRSVNDQTVRMLQKCGGDVEEV